MRSRSANPRSRMRRSAICRLVRLWGLVLLSIPAAGPKADADVSVGDGWQERGAMSLDSGEWRVVFAKGQPGVRVYDLSGAREAEVMSLVPFDADGNRATGITSCSLQSSSPREARCEVLFSAKKRPVAVVFGFDNTGAIRVQPAEGLGGVAVVAEFEYAVLPSRQLDDNVYRAADYPKLARLYVPSENLLVGLLAGGNRLVALAWPPGDQSARIALGGAEANRRIEALELTLGGRELFVGAFMAPGIWQRIELHPSYEEQDTALDWKPPFTAAWKMQLTELGVPTTFRCRESRQRPWRPTVGFYTYPFFVENGKVLLHLHKKLDSTGEALIYALEGHEKTPYGFLTAHLPSAGQREITELRAVEHYYVLDPNPVPGGFVMNAHCAGRDQLQYTTLAVGAQAREVPFLDTHISDRVHECEFIVTHHVQRSLDCMDSLDREIGGWIEGQAGNTAVLDFLGGLRETLAAMEEEYRGRLHGESPEDIIKRIRGVGDRFRSVIREDAGLELCPEILAYINELNTIISLEEDQGRRFGTLGRNLFQQAGYACVSDRKAAEYGKRVRSRLREHLRYRQYETPRTSGQVRSLLPDE